MDWSQYKDKEVTIEGTITKISEKNKKEKGIELKLENGRKVLIKIYGEGESYKRDMGKKAQAFGKINIPSGVRNPKTFNYNLYLKSLKIDCIMISSPEKIRIKGLGSRVLNTTGNFREDYKKKIRKYMKENSANMFLAIMFGDTSNLDENTYEEFQKNGTAHILSVSGLHVGLIYSFMNLLLGRGKRLFVNIVIAILLIFYAAVCDFSPTVIRAVIMILLHIFAKITHNQYDMLSAGFIAMGLMLLENPFAIFGIGFQMSFLAIFIISFFIRFFVDSKYVLLKLLGLPVMIQLGLAPFIAYSFNYISFSSFLANIPMAFLAGILVPLGIVSILLSLISKELTFVTAKILETFTEITVKINGSFYIENISSHNIVSPPLLIFLTYYFLLFFFASEMTRIWIGRRENRKVIKGITVGLVFLICFTFALPEKCKDPNIIFIDVGQGNSALFKTPSGKNILIDGGGKEDYDVGKKILMPFLLKNGVGKVDLGIVTHLDTDHFDGIVTLSNEGMIKKIGVHTMSEETLSMVKKRTSKREDILMLPFGENIVEDGDFKIKVLAPLEVVGEENEDCLVLKVSYGDLDILCTGDIGKETEEKLVDYYKNTGELESEVIIVPHHGSRFSSSEEFLEEVNPKIAIVQVGKNNYGHPTQEVLDRYKNIGAEVYRNDNQGAISINIKNGEIIFDTMM